MGVNHHANASCDQICYKTSGNYDSALWSKKLLLRFKIRMTQIFKKVGVFTKRSGSIAEMPRLKNQIFAALFNIQCILCNWLPQNATPNPISLSRICPLDLLTWRCQINWGVVTTMCYMKNDSQHVTCNECKGWIFLKKMTRLCRVYGIKSLHLFASASNSL